MLPDQLDKQKLIHGMDLNLITADWESPEFRLVEKHDDDAIKRVYFFFREIIFRDGDVALHDAAAAP